MDPNLNSGSTPIFCSDKYIFGNCTKGKSCIACQNLSKISDGKSDLKFNLNAKEFVPKKKQDFNLNAAEFVPGKKKTNQLQNDNYTNYNNGYDNGYYNDNLPNNEEIDMMVNDMLEDEDIYEDDEELVDKDEFFIQSKDCSCCKGFVYKCKGNPCVFLGACYCKVKEDCDDENDK